MAAFRFSLQFALDQAADEQESCERDVAESKREVAVQRVEVQKREENIERWKQQTRLARDNVKGSPGAGLESARFLEGERFAGSLRVRVSEALIGLAQQRVELRFAEHKVTLRQEELKEAVARVNALERLRDNELEEYQTIIRRREEAANDEYSATQSSRRRLESA